MAASQLAGLRRTMGRLMGAARSLGMLTLMGVPEAMLK